MIDQAIEAQFVGYEPAPYAKGQAAQDFNVRALAERHLQQTLDAERSRLEANLDTAATQVSTKLQQGPTEADIVAAWKAGNLPADAALVWPEYNLTKYPVTGVDPALMNLTDEQVKERLKNQKDDPHRRRDRVDEHLLPDGDAAVVRQLDS